MCIHDFRGLYPQGLQEPHGSAGRVAAVLPRLAKSIEAVEFRNLVEQQAEQAAKHRLRLAAALAAYGAADSVAVEPAVATRPERAETHAARVGAAACTLVSGHARAPARPIDHHALAAIKGELRAAGRDPAGLEEGVNQLALAVSLPAYD